MEASQPRVVLVHDWLTGMRGGEKCLEVVCQRWPQAQLRTLLHRKGAVSEAIEALNPRASWLQAVPGIFRLYRYFLPLFPAVVGSWRLPECDLVVSFSHCVAKSVQPPDRRSADTARLLLLHADALRLAHEAKPISGQSASVDSRLGWSILLLDRLRHWDRETADRVTPFHRHQPDRAAAHRRMLRPRQRRHLSASRYRLLLSSPCGRARTFISSSRRSLPTSGSTWPSRPAIGCAGSSSSSAPARTRRRLRALAGPTVTFLGWQPDDVIRDHLRRCRALLFPGEEDFGIVPLEAHGCGAPVIALGKGGATETVIPPETGGEPTGIWFAEPTSDCLVGAILSFESQASHYNPSAARRQALRFNRARFAHELFTYLDQVLSNNPSSRQAA